MAANHHRKPLAALTPSARAVATFPAAPPLAHPQARAIQARYGCHSWAGRPIPKWTRYGYWNAEGSELTVTRIM